MAFLVEAETSGTIFYRFFHGSTARNNDFSNFRFIPNSELSGHACKRYNAFCTTTLLCFIVICNNVSTKLSVDVVLLGRCEWKRNSFQPVNGGTLFSTSPSVLLNCRDEQL